MVRFFFDVDGVLLDFEASYMSILKTYFKLEVPEDYRPECWKFSDLLTEKEMMEGWQFFIDSPDFAELTPLLDIKQFNKVYQDAPVHLITNIPRKYKPARQKNLKRVELNYDSLHCAGFFKFEGEETINKSQKMKELAQEGETVFFLDDHPKNCEDVYKHFPEGHVWLMSRHFNREYENENIHRTEGWDEVFDFCKQLQQ